MPIFGRPSWAAALLDPGEQEHLVVHGQPEPERPDERYQGGLQAGYAFEVEQVRKVALDEHPDRDAQ